MKPANRFALKTKVPVVQTRNEIERLVEQHGADQFVYFSHAARSAIIGFRIAGRSMRITLPLPGDEFQEDQRRQVERQMWRVLLLVVKAKLEAVAGGVSTIEQEFLAWMVTGDGRTVGEIVLPQFKKGGALSLPAQGE